jgi:nitrogen fixation protein FixH
LTGAPRERRTDSLRDRLIPWYIVAFMAVVIAVNGVMVYFATSSYTGLQAEGHYSKGLAYNEVIAAERAEQALGWTVRLEFDQTGAMQGRVSAEARDASGEPLDGAIVTAWLVRPTQAGHDLRLALAPETGGIYAAEVRLPLPGQWDIKTQIEHPSGTYRTVRRIVAQ